jgi:hypothetical protein
MGDAVRRAKRVHVRNKCIRHRGINLIRRSLRPRSWQFMGVATGRFPQTREAGPDTDAASAPERAGSGRLAKTFELKKATRPMTTPHHGNGAKSTANDALSAQVSVSSRAVPDLSAGVAGNAQGWRAG